MKLINAVLEKDNCTDTYELSYRLLSACLPPRFLGSIVDVVTFATRPHMQLLESDVTCNLISYYELYNGSINFLQVLDQIFYKSFKIIFTGGPMKDLHWV